MIKAELLEKQLLLLWDAVIILALPASKQLMFLEMLGDRFAVDELALNYNDHFQVVNGMTVEQSKLTQNELSALRALDRQLDQMSGEKNAKNWKVEALQFSECWKEVRALASIALVKWQIAKLRK